MAENLAERAQERTEWAKTGKDANNDDAPKMVDALGPLSIWVGWKNIERQGKPTKIPFNPKNGKTAKANDPSTWATQQDAERWARAHSEQTGVVLTQVAAGLHLGGIDLDSCRDPQTGAMQPWALDVIKHLGSYTEVSPSGTGVKVFFLYSLSDKAEIDTLFGGENKHGRMFKRGGGEHPPAIEIHRSNRYFAVTWQTFESFAALRVVSIEDFRWLINEAGPAFAGKAKGARASSRPHDDSRSGKAFREGAWLKAGGATYEQMREGLLNSSDPEIADWAHEKGMPNDERELHRIYDRAPIEPGGGCTLEDFYAYMPQHSYIYIPTRELWPAVSINSRLPLVPLSKNGEPLGDEDGQQKKVKPNLWLDKNRPVEQMTWAPGEDVLIRDRLITNGGWTERKGATCFNQFQPPTIKHGDPTKAGRWLDHVRKVYPDDADHIIKWLAQRVQHPEVKINHALLLGGDTGIGKDTLLEPVKRAVGPWNFQEVTPRDFAGSFNPFVKAVILRISEAHDLGEISRYSFYDTTKNYIAAPPDVLLCNEKHIRQYTVVNCMGVVITTNHKTDGIYLPANDRRHYIAWSETTKDDFPPGYWNDIWQWYENGGFEHVAAYLATLDISDFDPKAPPPKTPAFWEIVDANCAPEEAELADTIEKIGNPNAFIIRDIMVEAEGGLCEWLRDRKNRRAIPYRLEKCGYAPIRNDAAADGLWKVMGKRQVIYAKKSLSKQEQFTAARELIAAKEELAKQPGPSIPF